MGIEIPDGEASDHASQAESESLAPEETSLPKPSASSKSCKVYIFLFVFGFLVAAILIALVPDWGKANSKSAEKKPYFKGFDSVLPIFDETITKGYENEEDLRNDLEQFASMTINQEINGFFDGGWGCGGLMYRGIDTPMEDSAADGTASFGGDSNLFDGVDDFGTNNQESSMDTADRAKSDGDFLYAAYGDTLVVMNATSGDILTRVQLPKINITQPKDGEEGGAKLMDSYPYYYNPRPYIVAILLEEDHLVLVVSGYGAEYQSQLTEPAPICNYKGTRIMVFRTNNGKPILLRQEDVHGSFRQAYSANAIGHVVTESSIDTWTNLREPIQRWKFPDLSDEEYQAEAVRIAKELIPKFAAKLSSILTAIDLTRLSLFVNSIDNQETLDGIMSKLRVADKVTMVSSFTIVDDSASASQMLDVSIAGTTQPGYWGYVYANDQMIVLADRGWEWVVEKEEYAEMTFLVGFRLDGASSKHEVVGSVFGSPLNSYSLDMVEEDGMLYIRIATTTVFWSGLFVDDEEGMVASWIDPDPINEEDSQAERETSNTWNEIAILGTQSGTGTVLEKQSAVRLGKPNEVFTAVRFLDDIAYAVTFERRDPLYTVDLSDPKNIAVLGELDVTGFSQYLHPIEGGKILAIGQETDDDGITIGLQVSLFGAEDPTNLSLVDRLVLLNQDNSWTSSGASWEPRAFRYFTVNDTGILIIPLSVYSWRSGVNEEDENHDDFMGFVVFTVKDDKISRRFEIDHEDFLKSNEEGCNTWCGDLAERSFVVDGNLLTLKSQSVVSTDLNTQKADWFINMRQELCCDI